ncbi:glycosyltransferase family 4 protein [Methylomarinum sp. Ch1-1]|uniref:Glycosyltransferase family 4 protein n=1 Tax=Methylomarinum roseum TaxID=3067653 RepID=A0AAU7NPV0_9GAMM|nr:glycosyltransferase family 4 protein [Methylomarinum sp. Ch1-1]MDP4521073.1 glycosyltransferase family 4 protein [Methylomarinum sp. Ch1-1]
MKLLFISRAYPPIVGGLENHNHELHKALQQKIYTDSIINKKGKKALPYFMPLCALKSLFVSSNYDAIILGDGVLAPIGWLIKLFKPNTLVICIIHGLDITYKNPIYQYFWVKAFLPKIDKIITVSQATASAAIERQIDKTKLAVIPNGITQQSNATQRNRQQLEDLLQTSCQEKTILLTVGRLVKRKGVHWFINQVMPYLSDKFIYIIAGDGPDRAAINKAIIEKQLTNRVFNLGFIDNGVKNMIYANADLFIQPNIKVDGDMEGFGIAVLEANLNGLAVVGSELEGLKDSITNDQNGWLIEAENPTAFIQKIEDVSKSDLELKNAGMNAKAFSLENFCWNKLADRYIKTIDELKVDENAY